MEPRGLISITPNPATHSFSIDFGNSGVNEVSVKIYDSYGVLRRRIARADEGTVFSTTHLPNGIYFVTITREGSGFNTQKLVVTK